jgi:hypothetical protein
MRSSITLLFFLLTSLATVAQCTVTVPENAIVVPSNIFSLEPVPATGEAIWVCPGALAHYQGDGNTFFMEAGADMVIQGDGLTIYFKKADEVVNVPSFLTLTNTGGGNTIYTDEDLMYIVNGAEGETITECPVLTFTYTTAPPAGCQVQVGMPEHERAPLTLYPNPATTELVISTHQRNSMVRIIDGHGRQVIEERGGALLRLDVSDLAAGLYTVIVEGEKQRQVRRLHKVN